VSRITKQRVGPGRYLNEGRSRLQEKKRLGILCCIVIAGVLVCTLWPFDPFPSNQVSWLSGGNGIRFGRHGILLSREPLRAESAHGREVCSLELLLQPADTDGGYTILNFYTSGNPKQFRVRQWTDGLLVSRSVLDASKNTKNQKFDVDHAFQPGKLLLITMTSGPEGTIVYLNGRQARVLPKFIFTKSDLSGQIVIGTSAIEYHPWRGEIRGLAVYSKELAPDEVLRNYENWTARGDAGEDLKGTIARYTFTERTGDEIHNTVASGTDLEIPRSFFIPYKPMLESPAKEFEANRTYLKDLLLNIAGFVPVGFLVCAYLGVTGSGKHAIVYAILVGGILSFVIEVLQFYIPSRGSGITDIVTNTLGAALGALLARPSLVRILLRGMDNVVYLWKPALLAD
jgi:VanZ family protein